MLLQPKSCVFQIVCYLTQLQQYNFFSILFRNFTHQSNISLHDIPSIKEY